MLAVAVSWVHVVPTSSMRHVETMAMVIRKQFEDGSTGRDAVSVGASRGLGTWRAFGGVAVLRRMPLELWGARVADRATVGEKEFEAASPHADVNQGMASRADGEKWILRQWCAMLGGSFFFA